MIRYLIVALAAISLQDNHAPVVKIINPASDATLKAGSPIRYEIAVADAEDGDSRYDEINAKEVVLEIRTGAAPKTNPLEAPGLAVMARSNCFNCHQFNGKSIGPTLAGIARRYPATAAIADTLERRIKDGSAGIWGKEKMPSHPELDAREIRQTIQWIEKYAAVPGVTYQNGAAGILQITTPGVYTLSAAYTDHGIKDAPGQYLTGLDRMKLTIQ
jgi:cytochrome c